MDLVIASNNKHKIEEIKQILGSKFENIFSLNQLGININVVEDGVTFEQNAVKKALEVFASTGKPSLSDDSGLCVDALNGAPGVHSARYSGENATDAKNNAKLLEELKYHSNRRAYFTSVVALCIDEKTIITASGKTCGSILLSPEGNNGFGYDPLFFSDELGICFGNATSEQKNAVSHRYKALTALLKKL